MNNWIKTVNFTGDWTKVLKICHGLHILGSLHAG